MRRHTDAEGRSWDVTVGRESFGAFYALFIPARDNPSGIRQALLSAGSPTAAEAELDALSAAELERILDRSEPKEN